MGSSRLTHEKYCFAVTLELVDVRVHPGERVIKVINHVTHSSLWEVAVVWKNHNDPIGGKNFRNEKPPSLVSNKPAGKDMGKRNGKEMGRNESKEEKSFGERKSEGKSYIPPATKTTCGNTIQNIGERKSGKGNREKKRETYDRSILLRLFLRETNVQKVPWILPVTNISDNKGAPQVILNCKAQSWHEATRINQQ